MLLLLLHLEERLLLQQLLYLLVGQWLGLQLLLLLGLWLWSWMLLRLLQLMLLGLLL